MTSKKTKAKRKAIPTFTIAELEDAGRLPPYTYLIDRLDKWADQNKVTEFPAEGASTWTQATED